jgi:hypothetical protein
LSLKPTRLAGLHLVTDLLHRAGDCRTAPLPGSLLGQRCSQWS